MTPAAPPSLLLLRRVGDGPGGAAKTLRRFESLFAPEWRVQSLSAGALAGRIAGARGPGWWRNLRFARTANDNLPACGADLTFTLERGVKADLCRTADGIHRRWLQLAYADKPLARLLNPLHHLLPRLERDTFAAARRIVCMGRLIADDVRRHYPEYAEKIRIIPIGVDPAKFHPHPDGRPAAKIALGRPAEHRLFVFVGTGWKIKNLTAAIQTFFEYQLHSADVEARLIIIGKGKPAPYRRLAEQLGIADRVEFLGVIPNVADYLRAADTLLMPSLYESFGNAALEAVACGCPLVTTDTVGASELVTPGVTGLVLPHGFHPSDAGHALASLMEHPPAPPRVAAAAAGRTAENERRLYLELLSEVLAEKQPAR